LQPVLKTLVAFANTSGGTLVIGVQDDGAVVGIADPLREEERLAEKLRSLEFRKIRLGCIIEQCYNSDDSSFIGSG
jgi:predicted HTH transcriptional regulator